MKKRKTYSPPTPQQVRVELERVKERQRYRGALRGTVSILATVAAFSVLVAMLWMPVLRIYGSSMAATLRNGEIVLSVKTPSPERGDIIAFYYNNKILIKRVVGVAGDRIDIDESGVVRVNDTPLEEPYVDEPSLGTCDTELPCQVPAGRFFVLGDNRPTSVDSRSTAVGLVSEEQIVGKVVFRVWPLNRLGRVG